MPEAIASTGHGGKRQGGVGHPKDQYVRLDVRTRLVEAKAAKEESLAKLAALEVAEKEGRLVDADLAEREARRAGMAVRDAVLSVPGRVAAQLVSMVDEREIERFLTSVLRAELTRVASLVPNRAA